MRETIKATLTYWVKQLHIDSDETIISSPILNALDRHDNDDEIRWLDYGLALFLDDAAISSGDKELRKLTQQVLSILEGRLAEDDEAGRAEEEAEQREYIFHEAVRQICNLHFFKEPRFKPDMSRYWDAIEAARTTCEPKIIAGLEKYLNETDLIKKLYGEVRGSLKYRHDLMAEGRLPALAEVDSEYQRALADIYRRADKTVFERLLKGGAK